MNHEDNTAQLAVVRESSTSPGPRRYQVAMGMTTPDNSVVKRSAMSDKGELAVGAQVPCTTCSCKQEHSTANHNHKNEEINKSIYIHMFTYRCRIVKSTSRSCISYNQINSDHVYINIFHSTFPRSLVPLLKTGQRR